MVKSFTREKIATSIEQEVGSVKTVAGVSMTVIDEDGAGNVTKAKGATVPSNGQAGCAKGCIFVHIDETDGDNPIYVNEGTASSCAFEQSSGGTPEVDAVTLDITHDATPDANGAPVVCKINQESITANLVAGGDGAPPAIPLSNGGVLVLSLIHI